MLVLALDTATTRMTVGVVELDDRGGDPTTRAARSGEGSRAHAEHLAPWIHDAVAEAGIRLPDVGAVVCGVGPGPFTGLRIGMVTASALGDALGVPVHGVATHDALAVGTPGTVLAVTDARRREVYWAVATDGVRRAGPDVARPADLADTLAADPELAGVTEAVGDAAAVLADLVPTLTVVEGREGPTPAGLVAVAASALRAGTTPAPLVPLYLRRPDAVPPGAPKAVSRPA